VEHHKPQLFEEVPLDYTIKIGGEAGQGVDTMSSLLGKVFSRAGCFVFTCQDYESRVRGGHNFFLLRISDRPVSSAREVVDILVALDPASVARHEGELSDTGIIIYDSTVLREKHDRPAFLDIPFTGLAVEHGGSRIMANTVATGAVLGMLGVGLEIFAGVIKEALGRKGEEVVAANINAARSGYEYSVKECLRCAFSVPLKGQGKMLINGNDAIGLGAVASGVRFYAAYPMTPSTGIMNFVASKAATHNIVVEQAEDEIAAINMVLGASFGGVRAMTGTSGGGFALMVEGLSLAGMTETPVVIALGQRPGPATGLPTRTEQGELLFALHAGHGEFPRVIFAPGTPEQAFFLTNKAFDLAEKFQVPAFILTDQYLADSEWTYDGFDLSRVVYHDYRLRGDTFAAIGGYRRHKLTESGITPLGVPGDGPYLVVTDSDEHDEEGHITEDAEIRRKMVDKRLLRKLPLIREEIGAPTFYGTGNPEIVVTGWGSTYGAIKEAVDQLSEEHRIAMLHFSEIYPFPLVEKFDYLGLLQGARLTICVEQNATGKFASLMRAETGYAFDRQISRFDGRPFTLESLIGEINGHIGRL
jgi:2-oxoglutarate/2-oxoacid ferredoxin oxidoreductase subunit alpha